MLLYIYMDNVFDLSKKRSPHSDEKHILTAEYQRRYEETLDGGLSDIDRIRFSYTEFSSVIAKEITDVCQTFLAQHPEYVGDVWDLRLVETAVEDATENDTSLEELCEVVQARLDVLLTHERLPEAPARVDPKVVQLGAYATTHTEGAADAVVIDMFDRSSKRR